MRFLLTILFCYNYFIYHKTFKHEWFTKWIHFNWNFLFFRDENIGMLLNNKAEIPHRSLYSTFMKTLFNLPQNLSKGKYTILCFIFKCLFWVFFIYICDFFNACFFSSFLLDGQVDFLWLSYCFSSMAQHRYNIKDVQVLISNGNND